MARAPALVLLTDFGLSDGYVGVMKGVILGIAPDAPLVDLTHEIPPQDVATGAWVLFTSWRYFPAGSVFVGVVDPGVGSARRAVALRAGGRTFIGPDNGLFSLVFAEQGVEAAVALDDPRYQLPQPSATFHGRDVFAPCAAHLAAGVPLTALGSPVAPDTLVRLPAPRLERHGSTAIGAIAHVDRFGNLITSIPPDLAAAALETPGTVLHLGEHEISARARTFAEGSESAPFLLRDSSGYLAVAVRNGSAAARLHAGRGDALRIEGLPPELPAPEK